MARHNNNQQRQNTAYRQARADLWDMVNAFITTPDIFSLQFQNGVGEVNITRVYRDAPLRRIGFATADAVSNRTVDTPDDDCDEYDDDYDRDEQDKDYNEFVKSFIRWLD